MAETNWAALAGGTAGQATIIIPTGRYQFRVTKAVAGRTNAGDKDTIRLTLAAEGGPVNGKIVWHQFTISPDSEQAMEMFFRQMAAFGLGVDYFKTLPPGGAGVAKIAAALLERRVMANVVHESYNDQPRAKLERFAKAAGPGVAPAPGGPAAAAPAPAPAQPAAAPAPAPAPVAAPAPAPIPEPGPDYEDEPF